MYYLVYSNYKYFSRFGFCFLQSSLNMQLYEKALELFEDDPSTSVCFWLNTLNFSFCPLIKHINEVFLLMDQVILHKHLLRSTATPMVDTLLKNLVTALDTFF